MSRTETRRERREASGFAGLRGSHPKAMPEAIPDAMTEATTDRTQAWPASGAVSCVGQAELHVRRPPRLGGNVFTARSPHEPLVLVDVKENRLWTVPEQDHEPAFLATAKPFEKPAKTPGGVSCGDNIIEVK